MFRPRIRSLSFLSCLLCAEELVFFLASPALSLHSWKISAPLFPFPADEESAEPAVRANAGTGPSISDSASPLDPAFSFEEDGLSRTPRGSPLTLAKIPAMSTKKTYVYIQDGQQEGPFFESQIMSMVNSGIIRADAIIQCVEDKAKGPLGEFLDSREHDLSGAVVIGDVKIPLNSILRLALQWTVALALIGIVLGILYAVLSAMLPR